MKRIFENGIETYYTFISILLMTPQLYYEVYHNNESTVLNNQCQTMFSIIKSDIAIRDMVKKTLDFFFVETVTYDDNNDVFLMTNDDKVVGFISENQYPAVCDIILQMQYIKGDGMDFSKVKGEKALEIAQKLQAGRKTQKRVSTNKSMELGNIISSICSKHPSLNYINIWDITVHQLWDTYQRLNINHINDLISTSVAVWGDKDKKFDSNYWSKNIYN